MARLDSPLNISPVEDRAAACGTMTVETDRHVPASFRDPSGYVHEVDGRILRTVRAPYVPTLGRLESCGLYEALASRGSLVRHHPAGSRREPDGTESVVIEHDRIPFISHPFEWSFGMLRDAALLTLDIQIEALKHDFVLKDASAYNIQFTNGRPIFIDTLSFAGYAEGRPWAAYRQFCQHFLAPLALQAKVDQRLGRLLTTYIDGIPLDLASRLLPLRTRFSWGLGIHVHAHARSLRTVASANSLDLENRAARARLPRQGLTNLIQSLRAVVEGLSWDKADSVWSSYYSNLDHYGATGLPAKEKIVGEILARIPRGTVWDVGANTGQFSRIAAAHHPTVVSWDFDSLCIETLYRAQRANGGAILPLVLDLANPSPALGWSQQERAGMIQRGPADTVLALGLMHHLVFALQVPIGDVAAFFRKIARRLVIEFVPVEDSQAALLASRVVGGGHAYTRDRFDQEFSRLFRIIERHPIEGTPRVIYLMEAV